MIILITGATHTGKTFYAQKLLEKHHCPTLSMDHVKMGLIRAGLIDARPTDSDEALTAAVWPVVREIIKTAIENEQNLIVEGCYVPADWESDFSADYRTKIQFHCLAMTEPYIRAHFDAIMRCASVIERRGANDDLTLDTALRENARFFALFGDSPGLTRIDTDFDTAIKELL